MCDLPNYQSQLIAVLAVETPLCRRWRTCCRSSSSCLPRKTSFRGPPLLTLRPQLQHIRASLFCACASRVIGTVTNSGRSLLVATMLATLVPRRGLRTIIFMATIYMTQDSGSNSIQQMSTFLFRQHTKIVLFSSVQIVFSSVQKTLFTSFPSPKFGEPG